MVVPSGVGPRRKTAKEYRISTLCAMCSSPLRAVHAAPLRFHPTAFVTGSVLAAGSSYAMQYAGGPPPRPSPADGPNLEIARSRLCDDMVND
jgi:hypothetical protein